MPAPVFDLTGFCAELTIVPELPEVETVRRGLNRLTLHQPIQAGSVLLDRAVAHPESADAFLKALQGLQIKTWKRRGKYLLAALSRAETPSQPQGWLGVHLRMTGQLLWVQQTTPVQGHTRVRLWFQDDRELRFVDQRTFGRLWWVPPARPVETVITGLRRLGPEPFSAAFSPTYLRSALEKRQRAIKTALLDQAIVAGLGNIYADETLFLSGIHPTRLCCDLQPHQVEILHQNIQNVLRSAINQGGTSFSNFLQVSGVNGNYGGIAWVYDRKGQPCRVCQTPIERLRLVGRSAHFCPYCQS